MPTPLASPSPKKSSSPESNRRYSNSYLTEHYNKQSLLTYQSSPNRTNTNNPHALQKPKQFTYTPTTPASRTIGSHLILSECYQLNGKRSNSIIKAENTTKQTTNQRIPKPKPEPKLEPLAKSTSAIETDNSYTLLLKTQNTHKSKTFHPGSLTSTEMQDCLTLKTVSDADRFEMEKQRRVGRGGTKGEGYENKIKGGSKTMEAEFGEWVKELGRN